MIGSALEDKETSSSPDPSIDAISEIWKMLIPYLPDGDEMRRTIGRHLDAHLDIRAYAKQGMRCTLDVLLPHVPEDVRTKIDRVIESIK